MTNLAGTYNDIPRRYFSRVKNQPKFKLWMGKDEDGNPKKPKEFNFLVGFLYKIERETAVWQGEEMEKVKYFFTNKEASEIGVIDAGFNTLYNYDFMNRLANLEEISQVKFLLWESQVEGTDKSYIRGSIHADIGNNKLEKVDLKYPYDSDEVPEVKRVKAGKKTVTDDSEKMEFYDNVLNNQIIPALKFNSEEEVKNFFDDSIHKPRKEFENQEAPDEEFANADLDEGSKTKKSKEKEKEEDEIPF